jgi:hypothetical protein
LNSIPGIGMERISINDHLRCFGLGSKVIDTPKECEENYGYEEDPMYYQPPKTSQVTRDEYPK